MKGLEVAVHSITLQLCILKTFIKTHNLLTLETLFKNHGGKAADGKIKEKLHIMNKTSKSLRLLSKSYEPHSIL